MFRCAIDWFLVPVRGSFLSLDLDLKRSWEERKHPSFCSHGILRASQDGYVGRCLTHCVAERMFVKEYNEKQQEGKSSEFCN